MHQFEISLVVKLWPRNKVPADAVLWALSIVSPNWSLGFLDVCSIGAVGVDHPMPLWRSEDGGSPHRDLKRKYSHKWLKEALPLQLEAGIINQIKENWINLSQWVRRRLRPNWRQQAKAPCFQLMWVLFPWPTQFKWLLGALASLSRHAQQIKSRALMLAS